MGFEDEFDTEGCLQAVLTQARAVFTLQLLRALIESCHWGIVSI